MIEDKDFRAADHGRKMLATLATLIGSANRSNEIAALVQSLESLPEGETALGDQLGYRYRRHGGGPRCLISWRRIRLSQNHHQRRRRNQARSRPHRSLLTAALTDPSDDSRPTSTGKIM